MTFGRLLICVVSLAALTFDARDAFAQGREPDPNSPGATTWLAPIVLSTRVQRIEPRATAPRAIDPSPGLTRATRISFNVFAGTAFGTGGAVVGALSGAIIGALVSSACGYYTLTCVTTGLVIGAASATIAAVPLGLMLGGSRFDGHGSWRLTYIGTIVGAALGFGAIVLGQGSAVAFIVGGALPLIAGITMYELTTRRDTPGDRTDRPSATLAARFRSGLRFSVAPITTGTGVTLGLGGVF